MARTFQNIRLFGTMTAVENVLVGRHGRLHAGVFGSVFRTPRTRREEREGRERSRELLEFVGVKSSLFEQTASYLSYGDQRRVEIARALASEPSLLLLDEPTAGMNPQETASLTEFMRKLRDELDLAILLIEHDMKVIMGVSRAGDGARPRREDRRGRAAGSAAEPEGHRGLPREAGVI